MTAKKRRMEKELRKLEARRRAIGLEAAELKMKMILSGRPDSDLARVEASLMRSGKTLRRARMLAPTD